MPSIEDTIIKHNLKWSGVTILAPSRLAEYSSRREPEPMLGSGIVAVTDEPNAGIYTLKTKSSITQKSRAFNLQSSSIASGGQNMSPARPLQYSRGLLFTASPSTANIISVPQNAAFKDQLISSHHQAGISPNTRKIEADDRTSW